MAMPHLMRATPMVTQSPEGGTRVIIILYCAQPEILYCKASEPFAAHELHADTCHDLQAHRLAAANVASLLAKFVIALTSEAVTIFSLQADEAGCRTGRQSSLHTLHRCTAWYTAPVKMGGKLGSMRWRSAGPLLAALLLLIAL